MSSTLHRQHLQGDPHTLERTSNFKGQPSPQCFIGRLVRQLVAFKDWYKQVVVDKKKSRLQTVCFEKEEKNFLM